MRKSLMRSDLKALLMVKSEFALCQEAKEQDWDLTILRVCLVLTCSLNSHYFNILQGNYLD